MFLSIRLFPHAKIYMLANYRDVQFLWLAITDYVTSGAMYMHLKILVTY